MIPGCEQTENKTRKLSLLRDFFLTPDLMVAAGRIKYTFNYFPEW